jgi:hypothetical protein
MRSSSGHHLRWSDFDVYLIYEQLGAELDVGFVFAARALERDARERYQDLGTVIHSHFFSTSAAITTLDPVHADVFASDALARSCQRRT